MTRIFSRRGGALLAGAALASFSLVLFACASGDSPKPVTESTEAPASVSGVTALPPDSMIPTTMSEMKVVDADRQVRVVGKPTLAALDFAAYYDNPIRLAGKDEKPENYAGKMAQAKLPEYPFPMLDSLSETEPAIVSGRQPMAWEPLSKILYAQTGNDSLAQVLSAVEAVKWGEPEVFRAFQSVSRLWGVPMSDGSVEWWPASPGQAVPHSMRN